MGAVANEQCGHCGTVVLEGFNVCRGCGARRTKKWAFRFLLAFVAFFLASCACSLVALQFLGPVKERTWIGPGLVLLLSAIAALLVCRMAPTKVIYVRRH